jgi:ABC-type nitrate/sulfonate/bicarbonate transport system ATPase subunit
MIELRGCRFVYPAGQGNAPLVALERVDLTIAPREFFCLLGPSGCGKTTLLKILAGLIQPSEGEVRIDGVPVRGPGPERAMVFQNFALLPWADVQTNIAFGLELRGVAKPERLRIAQELVRSVGLDGFERHYPRQLSGGMQQRVGLARALAVDPKILLMDEPFSALDTQTRRILQEEVVEIQSRTPRTVVFVTHSMEEAVRLGDRIALMTPRPGRIQEIIEVNLPWPRSADIEKSPLFVELKEYLWQQLRAMHVPSQPSRVQ